MRKKKKMKDSDSTPVMNTKMTIVEVGVIGIIEVNKIVTIVNLFYVIKYTTV